MRESFPDRAASFLSDFHVLEVGTPDWKAELVKLVKSPSLVALPSSALNNILDMAENQLGSKSIVIEPYISTDFADEYASFYSRIYQDVPRLCRRLHFFGAVGSGSQAVSKTDLLNLPADVRSAYQGYSVVRPTTPLSVGDTVLVSHHRQDELDLVHCQATFDVHLLGHTLQLTGMPFIEQESEVGVCADADLWMLARYMHKIGECRRFRPSEMHELATQSVFYGSAREGLVCGQMMDALRRMDLSPELFWAESADKTIALLYSCVESEIPVIVGLPGHVVTVIGHGYRDKMEVTEDTETMASFVNAFVAHDDAQGPYRWLPVGTLPPAGQFPERLTLGGQPVDWCIFPEPPRVNLRRSDVISMFRRWLKVIATDLKDWVMDDSETGKPGSWWTEADLAGLVTREYLRRNDKFKRDIFPTEDDPRWKKPNFARRPLELILRYWCQRLPKYVWVVELSRTSELAGKSPLERRIVGEAIFDSTSHHRDPLGALLALHLDDRLLIRNPQTAAPSFEFIGLSVHNSYSPLLRGGGPP